MQWLRLYDDVLDDPKVQQLRPELFRYWINLLCLANKSAPRGILPDLNTVAFRLRVPELKARTILTELLDSGLLDRDDETLRPHNWEDRQKRSDASADRVAKHRRNVTRNVTGPLHETEVKRDSNALDTDTDKNREDIPPTPSVEGESPKPKTRSVKTPIPDGLAGLIPDEDWAEIGAEQGLDRGQLEAETRMMLDHFRANGEGKVDWVAAWRNWMRSPYRKTSPATNGQSPRRAITADHAGEDREYLLRGLAPVWGSANGGIDSL